MAAMEIYEYYMGIQKGDGTEVPFSLSTMKRCKDHVVDSELERVTKAILRNKLPESTNMSVLQLLDLPRHYLMLLIKVSSEIAKESMSVPKDPPL